VAFDACCDSSNLACAQAHWDRRLVLILLFGLINGLLYACLLPLWDGFDEPFHYGYVVSLSVDRRLPKLQRTTISQELQQSFQFTPLPSVLSRAVPGTSSFDEWLALPEGERSARRTALAALSPGLRREKSDRPNYEAQQAPLAYVLLLPLDWLLSNLPLAPRILLLRLAICVSSTLLLACASMVLFQALGVERRFQIMALFLLFATQMTWAAIAHVGNDWLAIPVSAAFLAALAILVKRGGKGPAIWLAIFLSAGLLTKAYCLAFIPIFLAALLRESIRKTLRPATVVLAVAIPLVAAGPWYLRNLMLYGSASGTQESVAGVGVLRIWEAVPHINWVASTVRVARSSLWTGNWSFIAFPRWPLNLELILAGVALVILIAGRRGLASAGGWVLATCAMFLLAMAYQQAAMWAFSSGSSAQAEPWYFQCVMPGFVALVALSMQRGAWAGRLLARLLALTAAGISAVSYLGVLFPWYGGFRGHGSLEALRWWLSTNPPGAFSTAALAPAALLHGLLILFVAALSIATAVVVQGVGGERNGSGGARRDRTTE
jgi:hypothetical protein